MRIEAPAPYPESAWLAPRARPHLPDSRTGPVRSARTAPARSPQGRGGQGALGVEMARRLQTAARTLRATRSAMFAGVQRVSARWEFIF